MARYPPQIYWRRRALAMGIAVLVVGVIAAVVVMVVTNSAGRRDEERRQAGPDPGRRARPRSPVRIPRSSRRSCRRPRQRPAPTPTPTAAVTPPPVLKEGDDCPDSTLAVKGITSQPRVRGRRPAEVHDGRHQHRAGRVQARRRRRRARRLCLLAGQHAAVVEPGLRAVQRDAGQDVQPGRAGDHRGDLDRHGLGARTARCRASRSGRAPTTCSSSWATCGRRRCRSSSPQPAPAGRSPAPAEGAACRRAGAPPGPV